MQATPALACHTHPQFIHAVSLTRAAYYVATNYASAAWANSDSFWVRMVRT